nr:RNase H family protein [Candidatus Krumholzibacteria bacterium]
MTTSNQPETLTELLRTLERSGELRSLARECGLSVRELRRRLAIWRRELVSEDDEATDQAEVTVAADQETPKAPGKPQREKAPRVSQWPDLISASDIATNPLPDTGSNILEVFTDGASRGNPGPASVGMVFRQKAGPDLAEYCEAIGKATNNVAEYKAVVAA